MLGWREDGKKGGKRRKILCLVGEKLREGMKNGGNYFPWDPPFIFPSKLEGNEKKERVAHEPHLFPFFPTLQTEHNEGNYSPFPFHALPLSSPLPLSFAKHGVRAVGR